MYSLVSQSPMLSVRVTVSVLASLLVQSGQGTPPPPQPAIGDIRLVPYNDSTLTGYYEVQIYYTDGIKKAGFGGVCAYKAYKQESTVICHQLGYNYVGFTYRESNSRLWFSQIQCDDINTPHILRCKTNVSSSGGCSRRLFVSCDFTKPLDPYDGQVALCPMNSGDISSTSFGLVGIYNQKDDAWLGINQKRDGKLLGVYAADTICRQMGFTGAYPGSAIAISVDNYNFSNCFSKTPPFSFKEGAWATTDDITCQESQKCLGCCLKYPDRGYCGKCNTDHSLVIRCAFDPTKVNHNDGTAGSEDTCKLDSNKNVGHCATADNSQEIIKQLKIALGLVASFLVLLGPCGWYCLCQCYKNKLHNRCREKITRVPLVQKILCCKDYELIQQQVHNNHQDAEINQNQPA